jgi:hypothetical protein
LFAVCSELADECLDNPESVLKEADSVRRLAMGLDWEEDDFEERRSLLCSLAFVAWRASRLLGLSLDAQRWMAEYRKLFRGSLFWTVAGKNEAGLPEFPQVVDWRGLETVFQSILYLQDQRETDPEGTTALAEDLYRFLNTAPLPQDVRTFILAEAALLVGASLRVRGLITAVDRWAEIATTHLGGDLDPGPTLARIAFLRLTAFHEQSRFDLVVNAAPALDRSFADLGMDEDRVKCRIVWSASLKILGRVEEALEVLEPARHWRLKVRPELYGWVLLQSGDLNQLSGNYGVALLEMHEAEQLLREGKQLTGLADVDSMISCIYRSHGMLSEALQLLKRSCSEHAKLGMRSLEASNRMLIAETYLAMGRAHDAEIEIRAAIPVFEEQGMVADGVAAVNLMREARKRQRFDAEPIRDIRERPRPKK